MIQARHLSPEQARYERAKAERANYIVSEAIGDVDLMAKAFEGVEASQRGISLLWSEFLRWENSRHGKEDARIEHFGSKYELRVSPRVRDIITTLAPDDRANLEHALEEVSANALIDNVTKFALPYPPAVFILYQKGPFRIVYRIINSIVVDLLNLSWAEDVPSIADWNTSLN
jgi:mRNA-degrading endonuclease RelE of RelBE toxin-antitoxin system